MVGGARCDERAGQHMEPLHVVDDQRCRPGADRIGQRTAHRGWTNRHEALGCNSAPSVLFATRWPQQPTRSSAAADQRSFVSPDPPP